MSYLALYRKYRSKTFDEIVGQEAIVTTLKNVFITKKIAHAYLFCGPRGTGKTSIARLFAKALNCDEDLGNQCNECENCKLINEGTHPDVIEIDAASNSGVDGVRALIEKVKYAPLKGRYKVYIIDEVHMMTENAFNALLKTLEEPPEYVVFILCTTEPYQIIPTILSRCQRYDFSKISDESLSNLLIKVLKEENITYDDDVIENVVELANGGARDALSLLDQLIAFSGNHISLKNIQKVFGLTSIEEKINILNLIKYKKTNEILNTLHSFNLRNINISKLTDELLLSLKDTLIFLKTSNSSLLEYLKEKHAQELKEIFNEDELNDLITLLLECKKEFKTASNPSFVFEIYMLKACKTTTTIKQAQIEPKKEEIIQKEDEKPIEKPIISNVEEQKPIEKESEIVIKKEEAKPIEQSKIEEPKIINTSIVSNEGEQLELSIDNLIKLMVLGKKEDKKNLNHNVWPSLLDIKDEKLLPFASILNDGEPFIVTSNFIILIYDYRNLILKVNNKNNQIYFNKVLKDLTGISYQVYALNRNESTEGFKKYLNLQQVNKLPKAKEIDVKSIKFEIKEN